MATFIANVNSANTALGQGAPVPLSSDIYVLPLPATPTPAPTTGPAAWNPTDANDGTFVFVIIFAVVVVCICFVGYITSKEVYFTEAKLEEVSEVARKAVHTSQSRESMGVDPGLSGHASSIAHYTNSELTPPVGMKEGEGLI